MPFLKGSQGTAAGVSARGRIAAGLRPGGRERWERPRPAAASSGNSAQVRTGLSTRTATETCASLPPSETIHTANGW